MKVLATNKKALFNYEVLKQFQAGVVLQGWEVKSIKQGNVSLKESFVRINTGEAFIEGMHVGRWSGMNDYKEEFSTQSRKLLLKKSELSSLHTNVKTKGLTIVPLKLVLDRNKIKLEIALARGRKRFDKRAKLKEKDQKMQIERDLKDMRYN